MLGLALQRREARATPDVRIEWHRQWSATVDEAFALMPYDHLMDSEVIRALWRHGEGSEAQRIALARDQDGRPVGIIPLRKRRFRTGISWWRLLTDYVQPYARFHVLPGFTEATLAALRMFIAGHDLLFHEIPRGSRYVLQPQETWVIHHPGSYADLLRATGYREDRRVRRHAARFDLIEDRYTDLPIALAHWATKWASRGSPATAERYAELLVAYQVMAEQGRLKTFSLYDGANFAGMHILTKGEERAYSLKLVSLDEYRRDYPGIYTTLLGIEWACKSGLAETDLGRGSFGYKENWASPQVRGYRFVLPPLGSHGLALAMEHTWRGYRWASARMTRLDARLRGTRGVQRRLGIDPATVTGG